MIALDFDGTLAPLVDDPEDSRMLPEARSALEALTRLDGVSIALVSGRAIESLARVASPLQEWFLVGSHGIEILSPGEVLDYETPWLVPQRLQRGFEGVVSHHPGTRLEVKPFGLALHTRGVEPSLAREAEKEAAAVCDEWEGDLVIRSGHGILECSVTEADKGEGLLALVERTGASATLFAGDDLTDEDGFAVLGDQDFSLRVGPGESRARFRIADAAEMAQILWRVFELRSALSSS